MVCLAQRLRGHATHEFSPGPINTKLAGRQTLAADSPPLKSDALLKIASATKFISSLALLQCIDRGQITLDEPLTDTVIPELRNKEIIKAADNGVGYILVPNTKPITARHLLTHTSGLSYRFLSPLIEKWIKNTPEFPETSTNVWERYNVPLLFPPGEGWIYGYGMDWAGVVVKRLNGNISLEEYLIENVWKVVGVQAPFPTFKHQDHWQGREGEMMQLVKRDEESGELKAMEPVDFKFGACEEDGGGGLAMRMGDYTAVLQDLLQEEPKLLSNWLVEMMFQPQLEPDSPAIPMLMQLRPAWDAVSGPIKGGFVNHGLGGIVLQAETPEIGQPKNILAWGGASNVYWFLCREKGVAGFFATQVLPFADERVKALGNEWRRGFWRGFNGK